MEPINLTPFCETRECSRVANIGHPWTRGKFTYATDKRILIVVPARKEFPDNPLAPDIESFLRRNRAPKEGAFLSFQLPEECKLDADDEFGFFEYRGVDVGKRRIAKWLLVLIAKLPGIKIARDSGGRLTPLHFRFDGGFGMLMPLKVNKPAEAATHA